MKVKYAIAGIVLAASGSGMAAESIALPGPYIGANVGYVSAQVDRLTPKDEACQGDPTCVVTDVKRDTNSLGVKLFGGYLFNQYFALEGGYFNLGELAFDDKTNQGDVYKGTAAVQGLNVDVVGHVPVLDQFSLFGRLGINYAEVNKDFSYSGGTVSNPSGSLKDMNPDKWDVGYKVGLGAEYDFSPTFGVRGEWELYHMEEQDSETGLDMHLFSVGVVYRFGQSPEPEPMPEPVVVVKEVPVPAEPKVVEKEVLKEVVKEVPTPPVVFEKQIVERVVLAADTLFDFDKSVVKPQGQSALLNLVKRLNPGDELIVTGHTDSVGTDAYNMKLSQRRADAVKRQLIAFGLAASRIETRAMGESQPIASNATDEGRQLNRRVEIDIVTTPKTSEKVIGEEGE